MVKTAAKVAATLAAGAAFGALVATRRRSHGAQNRRVVRGVTIDRPPAQVYQFLRDPDRLLTALDERASIWARRIDPQITEEQPDRLLSWRISDGPLAHEGRLRVAEALADRGTELMVGLRYDGGGSGKDLDLLLRSNLRRIKQKLEAGTIIKVQGQPTGRGLIKERLTRKVQDKLTAGGRP